LQLRPYTQPTMELAVAAARSPSGGVLAGRDGVGLLSIGGTPPGPVGGPPPERELFQEDAPAHGPTPQPTGWPRRRLLSLPRTARIGASSASFTPPKRASGRARMSNSASRPPPSISAMPPPSRSPRAMSRTRPIG